MVTARDRELQEYLDDRMTDAERSAFERRCGTDEELAERVRVAREVREVLREPVEPPPERFYARARERFEAAGPATRSWWPALLSRETAGLVAAVALAAVIFVPPLLDRDHPAPVGTPPTPFHSPALVPETSDDHAPPADKPGPSEEFSVPDASDGSGVAEVPEVSGVAEVPEAYAVSETEIENRAEAAPPTFETRATESRSAPPRPAPTPKEGARRATAAKSGPAYRIGELRGPVIGSGEYRVVETADTWTELFGDPPGDAAPAGPGFVAGERWIVIGPGRGSCAEVEVLAGTGEIAIRTAPAGARSRGSRWGCVVILAADRRTVRVIDSVEAGSGS